MRYVATTVISVQKATDLTAVIFFLLLCRWGVSIPCLRLLCWGEGVTAHSPQVQEGMGGERAGLVFHSELQQPHALRKDLITTDTQERMVIQSVLWWGLT